MIRHFLITSVAAASLVILLCGCSVPRITVHDDPLSPQEHLKLGVAYEDAELLDLAEEQYRKATEIPESNLLLGNLAFRKKDWDEAKRRYLNAIQKMPTDPRPRNNLAWLYYTRKRSLKRAEELAEQAVALAGDGDASQYMDTLKAIRRLKRE
jgi:Flp pilus assembly protein TadD